MTGWEDELLGYLTNEAGGVLLYICGAFAGIFAFEYVATQQAWSDEPPHPPATSPLQHLDSWGIVFALIPLTVCLLLQFQDGTPALAYGSAVVFIGFFALLMAFWAANWQTTVPLILIAVALLVFRKSLERDIRIAAPKSPPLHERIRISAAGNIPDMDLWLNGERIDSLPLECDASELAAKVPKARPTDGLPGYRSQLHDREFRCLNHWYAGASHRGYVPQWANFYLKFPGTGTRHDYESLYAKISVTINGVRAFPKWTGSDFEAGEAVSFTGSDRTDHVVLGIRTIEWEHDLARLADIARTRNYEVDQAWCDAALTYEPRAWYYFRELVPFESHFRGILDQLAQQAYRVDEIETIDAAWAKLMEISRYFIERGHFDSRSLEAKALEFVAGKVSPRRLTDRCGHLLHDGRSKLITYISRIGGVTWLTATDEFSTFRPVEQAVFGYAAWCLDRALDKQHPDHENVLEKWLTPRLLRHHDLQSARIIGGPAWQAFSESNPDAGPDDLKEFPDLSGIGYMRHNVLGFAFKSASEFLQRREEEFQKNGPKHLREMTACDRYHDEAVVLLAAHSHIEFRSAALLAVRFHPTPRRRKLLDVLEDDEDPRIRSEVAECREYLKELRSSPYPRRQMPEPQAKSPTTATP